MCLITTPNYSLLDLVTLMVTVFTTCSYVKIIKVHRIYVYDSSFKVHISKKLLGCTILHNFYEGVQLSKEHVHSLNNLTTSFGILRTDG